LRREDTKCSLGRVLEHQACKQIRTSDALS
jgi:hypothetical protein